MTRNRLYSRVFALTIPFALSACGLTDWADANMPVIGQRCEHWQCFTSSGEQESEAIHNQRIKQEAAAAHGTVPAENPGAPAPGAQSPAAQNSAAPYPGAPAAASAADPNAPGPSDADVQAIMGGSPPPSQKPSEPKPYVAPDPTAPGMSPVPTYTYVPRPPAPPGSTPFDGNIQPLDQ